MRNLFSHFRGLIPLIALLFMLPAMMRGADVELISTLNTTSTVTLGSTATKIGVMSLTATKYGNNNMPVFNYNATNGVDLRFYKGSTVKFSIESGYKIKSITFSKNGGLTSANKNSLNGNLSVNVGNFSNGVWTAPSSGNTTNVTFTCGTSSNVTGIIFIITVEYESLSAPLSSPSNLSAGTPTSTGTTLSWGAVANATGYKVEYKVSSASSWTAVEPNPTTTSCELTGLTPSTTYAWQVTALATGNYSNSQPQAGTNFTTADPESHRAYFYVNGTLQNEGGTLFDEGASIEFPEASVEDKSFAGWTKIPNYSHPTDEPSDLCKSATMGDADVNFYAVFADGQPGTQKTVKLTCSATAANTSYTEYTNNDDAGNTWNLYTNVQKNSKNNVDYYCYGLNSNAKGYCIASPTFSGNVFSVKVGAWNGSSSARRAFLCSSNTTKQPTTGDLSSISIDGSAKNLEKEFSLAENASFSKFYIYATSDGAIGIQWIEVTYGSSTTYSNYCTAVSTDPKPTIVLGANTLSEYAGNTNTSITASVSEGAYTGTLEASSDKEAVATASIEDGQVVINALKAGTANITITAPAITGFRKATATIAVTVNEKLAHGLAFDATELSLTVGATEIVEPKLLNPNSLPVVYSLVYETPANEGKVATIDPATGKITLTGLSTETQGAVTVKAHTDGDNSHAGGNVTYNLIVARKVSITSWKKDGKVVSAITIDQDELALLPSATNSADRNIQYESSNTGVANFVDGVLTFVNYGTTTITAKTSATAEYAATSASYELTFAPRYTVSFKYTDESKAAEDIREATTGAGVTLPNIKVAEGKLFKGWSTENPATSADAGVASATYMPTANTPLYAYIVDVYAVTFNGTVEHGSFVVKNGDDAIDSGDEFEVGTELTVVCTNYDHYHVASVTANSTEVPYENNKYSFNMPAEAVEVSVEFEEDVKFEVSWMVNGFEAKKENLYADVHVSAPVVSAQGNKEFMGWVESRIDEATDTKPDMVDVSGLTVSEDKIFYAVFATLTAGSGEKTIELTNKVIKDTRTNNTSGYCDATMGDWSGWYAFNLNSNVYSLQLGYNADSNKSAYNSHLSTPECSEAITKVIIYSSSKNSSAATFYLCNSDEVGAAAESDATYGMGTLSQSASGTATINVTGDPTQVHIYPSATVYIDHVVVTYGSADTYSDYCTSITSCDITLTHPESGDYGFSTFCGSANYTVEGADAYKASVVSGELVLTKLEGIIPAGNDNYENGVVIAGNPGETATIHYTTDEASADMKDNQLLGTLAVTSAETLKNGADYLMVFSKNKGGFVSYTGENVPAYKACLPYNSPVPVGGAPMRMVFGRDNLPTNNVNVNVNDNQGTKVMIDGRLYILRDGKTYDSFGRLVK